MQQKQLAAKTKLNASHISNRRRAVAAKPSSNGPPLALGARSSASRRAGQGLGAPRRGRSAPERLIRKQQSHREFTVVVADALG